VRISAKPLRASRNKMLRGSRAVLTAAPENAPTYGQVVKSIAWHSMGSFPNLIAIGDAED